MLALVAGLWAAPVAADAPPTDPSQAWARSSSGDQSRVAVYGALRGSDGALTVALVNKSAQPLASPLALPGLEAATAQAWQRQGATPAEPPQQVADRLGLPSPRRCVPAVRLTFRLRSPTTRRLQSAQVSLGRRRPATISGRRLSRPVVVGGLPRDGAFTVHVRLTLAGERRPVAAHRRYRRCP
jgi:hypothetical protein